MGGSAVRSVGAVIAGFVATVVLSVACDAIVRMLAPGAFGADGRTPGPAMMVAGIAYTLLSATAGGFVAGLIAGRREIMHALVLGTLGAVATLLIVVAAPAAQRTVGMFVSAMLVIPATVLGGWLRVRGRPGTGEAIVQPDDQT
jgi:hypothetical protein